ncbi:MarR family winged helix-turn-helix transcriptional regulator [Streptomyces europaeiscabiei]|uniref:MarR family winged helix-turn-helix transcriptional regulator n=1 Tax=Streptomyces TaxID=1883 RepID=UPI000A364727|nr:MULTISPECIES: MarR family winged helix-turn-helix transcriptional regulator [Streptomyces]MDX3584651.1 MarR family winged helix-turn-helix transcriptional regulator [Streptomyces europaeiscabiei]MDX3632085.1 MarR family winged helix-turn-helix transcriptional regulator [Streptomyces europaeiscabiei]MDX3649821.1 MarR family winged helix-turn-helix transcriptional regulator [Streptomyces europaeiscabiei]WUD36940.1 MarR family winged helix-turn-helix transcriptional regulator [Streptomyces euro
MTTTAPPVNGRVVALAHYASRAVLESVLTGYGLTFQQSVTLRVVAVADEPVDRDGLVDQVVGFLKVEKADIRAVVEELASAKLVETDPARPSRIRITDAGQEAFTRSTAETAPISARIYAGLPAEDLAATGRVLTLVTERANAELASLKKEQ